MKSTCQFVSSANAPFFSVIIPCYNHARFLPEAVDSLLRQGVVSLEAIIVNDGSTDNTDLVARALVEQYPGLQYLEQSNSGPAIARNKGVAQAGGQWICTLDSDDILADGFLGKVMDAVATNPACNAVAGAYREFGARESEWKLTRFNSERLKERGNILNSTPFKKSLWEAAKGFDASNPWGGEDGHFWLKTLNHGLSLLTIPVPMLWYRIHPDSGRMHARRNYQADHLAMQRSMTLGVYTKEQLQEAHKHLLHMSPETEKALCRHAERHRELPLPLFWLGLAHEGRGNIQAAREYYEQALVLAVDSPVHEQIREWCEGLN